MEAMAVMAAMAVAAAAMVGIVRKHHMYLGS